MSIGASRSMSLTSAEIDVGTTKGDPSTVVAFSEKPDPPTYLEIVGAIVP